MLNLALCDLSACQVTGLRELCATHLSLSHFCSSVGLI